MKTDAQIHGSHSRRSIVWGWVISLLMVFSLLGGEKAVTASALLASSEAVSTAGYQQLVAGAVHTCGLTAAGGVQCWGSNWAGQLGDGTFFSFGVPVNVIGLSSGVQELTSGINFTCALLGSGQVSCWGENALGQLGDGTTNNTPQPVVVAGLSAVTQISAGSEHVCAIAGGTLKCWGGNSKGQLGDNSSTNAGAPVNVTGLGGAVTAVEAGGYHTCAILTSGSVRCWGNNEFGQLGDGTNDQALQPVGVSGLSKGVIQLSAGDHTCARLDTGEVQCWGHNWAGQLGNGTSLDSNVPVQVLGLAASVTQVEVGGGYTCAIEAGGGMQCWGANEFGQLGDGSKIASLLPVNVIGMGTGAVTLGAAYSHACASTSSAAVCWGANWEGELGNGLTMLYTVPQEVVNLDNNFVSMAAGNGIACSLDNTGSVFCWGNSWAGQLGNGTRDRVSSPTPVSGLDHQVQAISVMDATICVLTTGNGVKCWGLNDKGQVGNNSDQVALTPVDVVGLQSGVTALVSGRQHNCALLADKTVKCWGNNQQGQLGDGGTTNSWVPVAVSGLTGVEALTAGSDHTCAVVNEGKVRCWGGNGDGQLGDGSNDPSLQPIDVMGLTQVTKLAATLWDTCALTSTGAVKCWGAGYSGQLGNGADSPSNVPVDVLGLGDGVTAVAGGFDHFCAIRNSGLFCWGANDFVQLGSGQSGSHLNMPTGVMGMAANVTAVTPGSSFTCAVANGRVKCWGNNAGDALGSGREFFYPTPVTVLAERTQSIQSGYSEGAPGSIFTIRGSGFAAGENIIVSLTTLASPISMQSTRAKAALQGTKLTLKASEQGDFILFLDMKGAQVGSYHLQAVGGNHTASTDLTLSAGAPLRQPEGAGTRLSFYNLLYLPAVKH